MKLLALGAAARRGLTDRRSRRGMRMGGFATGMVVMVGLLAGACSSSSASPAGSSVTATTNSNVHQASRWSTVNIDTGSTTRLPADITTSGAFYVVSPNRLKVAFNKCCDWGTPARMANSDGTQVQSITAAGMDGVGEQWSPDSSLLVYQQRDGSSSQLGNLFLQNVATGQRTRLTNLNQKQEWGWWFTFPSFSSDGKSVLFQLPKGHLPNDDNRIWDLWSVPVAGGKPTLVRRNAAWGSYSPNGKRLAYLSRLRQRDFTGAVLWVTSVHGGTPRALVRGPGLRWLRWSPNGTRIAYTDGNAIYTVDAATGTTTKVVGHGDQPEWLNNHTLVFTS
jgi:hypothetical protein